MAARGVMAFSYTEDGGGDAGGRLGVVGVGGLWATPINHPSAARPPPGADRPSSVCEWAGLQSPQQRRGSNTDTAAGHRIQRWPDAVTALGGHLLF